MATRTAIGYAIAANFYLPAELLKIACRIGTGAGAVNCPRKLTLAYEEVYATFTSGARR